MKKRELSHFMIQEMLFDYANGELGTELTAEIKQEIEKSKALQDELFQIKTGLGYFKNMHELKISSLLIEEIKSDKSYFQQVTHFLSLNQWPPIVKWTIEAFVIIFVVVLVTVMTPWGKVKEIVFQESQTELILAEVTKKNRTDEYAQVENQSPDSKKNIESFEDEETPVVTAASENVKAELPKVVSINQIDTPKKIVKTEDVKKQGFVYRGTASIVNAQAGASKLKSKIVEFGGRKAGEVELGWRRNQGDYYFHFTIPESRFQELEGYVKSLGELKMSRDPHPRVMPSGIIRIILTTEESRN